MVSMSANIELQSQMKGGLFGAIKRAAGGESAFISTFTARGGPGEVTLAPGAPGDIAAIELTGQPFFVQSSSYLAGDASLTVDTKWGGAKSFFSGEGLFVLMVQGQGLLLVSSFGAIHRKRLQAGERYVVDTGHLVAWEGTTQYTLRKAASGFFRSMMSGEGIVAEFTGPGELLIQTRNLAALAGLLKPFFPSSGRRRWWIQSQSRWLDCSEHESRNVKKISQHSWCAAGLWREHGRRRYWSRRAARRAFESAHRTSWLFSSRSRRHASRTSADASGSR